MDKVAFAVLKAELEERYWDVCHVYERIEKRKARFGETDENLDSMAYQLHNLYSAFEQLFETVAHSFENQIEGEGYHAGLLLRMKLEIEGVRPALISDATFALLDELRRFRHFFRHAYTADLDAEKMGELVTSAEQLRASFPMDKDTFLGQLMS